MPGHLGSRRLRTTHDLGAARPQPQPQPQPQSQSQSQSQPQSQSPSQSQSPGWHLALRAGGGLFLGATGVEHMVLDLAGGYGHIPTIGTLFLFQAAGALALGVVVLASPMALASIAGALFALATLGGYLLSLGVGLFGFREVVTAAGIASGLMDIVAFALLASAVTLAPASKRLLRGPRSVQRVRVGVPWVALAALAAFAVELAQASPVGGIAVFANAQVVRAVHVDGYGNVLATPRGRTLYVLRARDGAQRPCSGGCLSIWPPLLVAASVHEVRGGPGVRGAVGLAVRDGQRQVTFNGYRLYTYAGDTGPRQSNGERVVSFGGTWYLVRASATGAATTAITRGGTRPGRQERGAAGSSAKRSMTSAAVHEKSLAPAGAPVIGS